MRKAVIVFLLLICSLTWGQEDLCLRNIRQVTFPSMGFEKAGESYFSPDGQSLIFQAVPQGKQHYQIYTLELQTGLLRRVSTGEGACTCGFYKPDGTKILFASSHEAVLQKTAVASSHYEWELTPYMNIYEANLDGTELKKLTTGPAYHAECAYSPDGKQIVFASNETGHMNLYICDANGENRCALTQGKDCYNGGPFFSPDGSWIIFRADRERKNFLQLFMIRSDGREERQLTADNNVNWAPFWHPGGQVVAYTTSKHGHHAYQIYLLDVSTQKSYRLTYSNSFEGLPSFSADGRQITWTSKRGGGAPHVFIADFTLPSSLLD